MYILIKPRISKAIFLTVVALITCFTLPKVVWSCLNYAGLNAIYNLNTTCHKRVYYAEQSANAIFFYTTALKLAEETHMNNATKMESILNLANAYQQVENYDLAETYYLQALKLFQSKPEPNQDAIRWSLNELIANSNQQNKPQRAKYYEQKLEALVSKSNSP